MSLRRGGTYLLTAQRVEARSRLPIVRINSCGYNVRLNVLTQRDWEFLETRLNCCGDECICNDGSQPVNCFADPCQVSACDYPGAECVANYCGGCNAEWYDETGAQVCTDPCREDADCGVDSWCRPDEQGVGQCVPFVGPGEKCEGFVLPWIRERCADGLTCVPVEETGDVPGICAACNVDGVPHQAGESFPVDDGCNTCTCTEGGLVACTKIACIPVCEYNGTTYQSGDTFPAVDGCNKCQCLDDGTVACTEMACPPVCEYDGVRHEPGDSFPADDGCNECVCLDNGTVVCTLRPCPPPVCEYGGGLYQSGVAFPADDGCNMCECQPDGTVICTMMPCRLQL